MPGINEVAYKGPADTNERFILQDDGKMIWGSGSAIGDVILSRTGATTLTLVGAISTTQSAVPTVPSPAAGFSAVSFSAASTDVDGQITFTTATPAASAVALPVVFSRTYPAAPKSVVLTLGTSQTNDPITFFYVTALAATGFTIATNATAVAQTGVVLNYHVGF